MSFILTSASSSNAMVKASKQIFACLISLYDMGVAETSLNAWSELNVNYKNRFGTF